MEQFDDLRPVISGTVQPLFALGYVCVTAEVTRVVPPEEAANALKRHAAGDWGDIAEDDRRLNEMALEQGMRLFSSYPLPGGTGHFWIITEEDRSITTILLPSDY